MLKSFLKSWFLSRESSKRQAARGSSYPLNIILISLDCVRYDSLGCFGYPGNVTPNIDTISRDSVIFEQAISQAPYTPASHASILTGLNPYRHGIQRMFGRKLRENIPTVAEILRKRGYKTGAFVSATALSMEYGLNKGFDVYEDNFSNGRAIGGIWGAMRPSKDTTKVALRWLRDNRKEQFFLFIHYFDAHDRSGKPFNRSSVQAELKGIDKEVGRLLKYLRRTGVYDQTLIIVTADHGDSFGEHGERSHREFLYDTTLRVPLIIKAPNNNGSHAVETQVRLIDIAPTILEYTGVEQNTFEFDGVSLVPLCSGRGSESELLAYSETSREKSELDFEVLTRDLISIRTQEFKYIYDRITGEEQLYSLVDDPAETINIAVEKRGEAKRLQSILFEMISTKINNRTVTMTTDEVNKIKESLKTFGYIE